MKHRTVTSFCVIKTLTLSIAIAVCAGCQPESSEMDALRTKDATLEARLSDLAASSPGVDQREHASVGRYTLLNCTEAKFGPAVLKIDTATGQAWRLDNWQWNPDAVVAPVSLWEEIMADHSEAAAWFEKVKGSKK